MTTVVPKSPAVKAGVVLVLVMVLVGIFAPLLAPYDPQEQQIRIQHTPPMSTGGSAERASAGLAPGGSLSVGEAYAVFALGL